MVKRVSDKQKLRNYAIALFEAGVITIEHQRIIMNKLSI